MSMVNARSVLLALSDEPLGLDSVGRLAVAALTGAAAASGGASPAELLEALLQMRDAMVGSSHGGNAVQQASLQWVRGAAAVVLLRQLAGAQSSGEQANSRAAAAGAAVEQLLLPALANVGSDTTERQQALAAAMAEAVAAFRCWGLAVRLVQAATASPLVMQADTLSGGSQQQQQLQQLPSLSETMGQLSAEQRMHLAAAVLQEALRAQASEGAQQAEQALRAVLQQAAEHTLPAVLQLLVAKQPRQAGGSKASTQQQRAAAAAARSAARQLLAAALQAACAVQQQGPAMQQLWAACRELLGVPGQARQLGLTLLVQFCGMLLQPAGSSTPHAAATAGLRGDAHFWRLLRQCLADAELANRKCAAHVLQQAVAGPDGQPPPGWRPLLKLLGCLEELAPHLVKDGWEEIDGLHPPAACAAPGSAELACAAAVGGSGSPNSWAWLEVVWSQGLGHEHRQVQRQVLSSYLNRSWQADHRHQQQQTGAGGVSLADVPQGFVLLTLLPAAGQAHMWRGEGSAQLQKRLAAWVGCYAAAQARAGPQQAQQLLLGLLAGLESGAGSGQQQRPLVQTLAAALQAAAQATGAGAAGSSDAARYLLFLRRLQQATGRLSTHWGSTNSSHACSTCRSLLAAAAAVVALPPQNRAAWGAEASGVSSGDVQLLAAAAAWLQELPLALLLPGGELHFEASAWVGSGGWQRKLPLLAACVQDFMTGEPLGLEEHAAEEDNSTLPQAADGWADWQRQSAGLACMAMLLAAGGDCAGGPRGAGTAEAAQMSVAQLGAAFAGWSEVLGVLYRRPYLSTGLAERCLLLLSALLSVCLPSPAAAADSQLSAGGHWQKGQQTGRLAELLGSVLAAAADELASYAGMLAGASLWARQQSRALPEGPTAGSAQGDAVRGAQLALSCLCRGLQLLACQTGTPQYAGTAPAGRQLAGACLQTLRSFVEVQEGQQLAAPANWDVQHWQQAAAQLLPIADCCPALSVAVSVGWLDGPRQAAAASAADAALEAVLRLQAAALDAAAAAQARGKAATASGTAGALAAYTHRLCWKAAHALVLLLQRLRCERAAQASVQQQLPPQDQPQRWAEQQAAVLAAALTSMQRSAQLPALASDARGILFQLRCCRLVLPAALADAQMARLALDHRQQREQRPQRLQQEAALAGGGADAELAAWLCQAAWQVYEGAAVATKRRRAGLTAAVVSCCLHPQLFEPRPSSSVLHGPGGPLQLLLGRLLDLGAKSWRIMSITSLQLFGLLSRQPELAPYYQGSLQQALLWGMSEDPGQNGVGDPVDADSAAELAVLLAPADAELAAAFAGSELAPRCAALCLLRCWVEQSGQQGQQNAMPQQSEAGMAAGPAGAAREAGQFVWRRLLALAATDPELSAARYSPLGHVHRKKVRLWQALCTLSPLVPDDQVEADFDALLAALDKPELSTVRQYIDTAALVLLHRRPALLRSKVLPALLDCSTSGTHALSSLIIIAARELVRRLRPAGAAHLPSGGAGAEGGSDAACGCAQTGGSSQLAAQPDGQQRVVQAAALDGNEELLDEVLGAVAPWALSHVHALRTFSQLVLCRLYDLFPSVPERDATAAALLHFFSQNEDVCRLRRGLSHTFYFDSFDVERAVTPAAMLCMGTSVLRADASFEGAPQPLMDAVQAFLASERQSLRQDLRESKASATAAEFAPAASLGQLAPAGAGGGSNWQKKGGGAPASARMAGTTAGSLLSAAAATGAWADALGSAALLGCGLDQTEAELAAAADAAAAARGGPRQQIVVVASLLDRAPNLAGLARTCEVFRASCLVLGDLSVTRRQEFINIAVTAHQWIPLAEVPEAALATWLQAQAAAGWALVGLEQTAESVQLQDFTFPERTVLVLGREREGIPPYILGLLHSTVEIPQLGLIRSLNVHVSGAICMWELTRQRLVKRAAAAGDTGATAGLAP